MSGFLMSLAHVTSNAPFLYSLKGQKTFVFQMVSGGIEMVYELIWVKGI